MDLQLTGKRVLVTGGTRGIGRAIVGAFLDEGAVVGFCARDSGDVARTNDELRSRGNVTGSVVDVGDGDALRALGREVGRGLRGPRRRGGERQRYRDPEHR